MLNSQGWSNVNVKAISRTYCEPFCNDATPNSIMTSSCFYPSPHPSGGVEWQSCDVRLCGAQWRAWHFAAQNCQCAVWLMQSGEWCLPPFPKLWSRGQCSTWVCSGGFQCHLQGLRCQAGQVGGTSKFGEAMDWIWGFQGGSGEAHWRAQQAFQSRWWLHGKWWEDRVVEHLSTLASRSFTLGKNWTCLMGFTTILTIYSVSIQISKVWAGHFKIYWIINIDLKLMMVPTLLTWLLQACSQFRCWPCRQADQAVWPQDVHRGRHLQLAETVTR